MPVTEKDLRRAASVAQAWGAARLILFGSALETPATARDVDLAVEGMPGWGAFELAAALEAALPVPVDVIPLDGVDESYFTRQLRERGRVLFERAEHLP